MSIRTRSVLAMTLLLPSATAALWTTDAQACDWAPGIQSVHPASTSTLASNDAIVIAMLEDSLEAGDILILVDGEEVEAQTPVLFEGHSVFLSTDHHVLTLPEGTLVEGASVVVNRIDEVDGAANELATYTVGAADESPLLSTAPTATLEVAFEPADEGDSCQVPDSFSAHLVLDAPLSFDDGARNRFVELVFYPADQSPEEAVGRSARPVEDEFAELYASAPGDLDPSTLCARASVTDISGEEEVLLEDCALCDTFPELCDDGGGETGGGETGGGGETDGGGGESDGGGGESDGGGESGGGAESDSDSAGGAEGGSGGGCTVGGAPGSLALVLLGMFGAGLRRRRRS